MEKIWQWRRWEVYIYEKWNKKIAKKIALDQTKKASILKEIDIIKKLNNNWIKFVPQIESIWENYFEYQYIEGESFDKIFDKSTNFKKKKLIKSLLQKIYILDKLWVIHGEMIRPFSNILVDKKNNINIIDFERWTIWDFTWKNMRSFSQWLKNQKYLDIDDLKKIWKLKSIKEIYLYIKRKIEYIPICYSIIFIFLLVILDLFTKYIFYDLWYFQFLPFIKQAFNEWISWWISVNYSIVYFLTFFSTIFFIFLLKKNWISSFIFVLLFAGTIWNLIDRLYLGGVRDFISILDFPIFNFADMYLSFAILYILYEEFIKK